LTPGQTVFRDFQSEAQFADFVFENPGPQLKWEPEFLPQQPIWLVCGVAQPEKVREFYRARGVSIERLFPFPDHHEYREDEVTRILSEAKVAHRKVFLTEKDAVKWRKFQVQDSIGVLRVNLQDRRWMNEVFDRLGLSS
jgi:tetraacyldisaccharide-1-P 4'-kinase